VRRIGGEEQIADGDIGGGKVGGHATQRCAEGNGHEQFAGRNPGAASGLHGAGEQNGSDNHVVHQQRESSGEGSKEKNQARF